MLIYLFLVPPLLYLLLFKKVGKQVKIVTLVCYCITMFLLLQFGDDFLPKRYRYPIFTFTEYSFFTILIYQQLATKRNKLTVLILSTIFVCFQAYYFFSTHRRQLDSVPIGVETIFIFIFVSLFFSEQLKEIDENPIYTNYFFWIAVGLVFYLGGSFFVYILANNLSREELERYWYWTWIAEIIKNVLITFALILYTKSKKDSRSQQSRPIPYLDMI